jgi:hypothetical protein
VVGRDGRLIREDREVRGDDAIPFGGLQKEGEAVTRWPDSRLAKDAGSKVGGESGVLR